MSDPSCATNGTWDREDDLPTSPSYVVEYAWACNDCGEVNGTEDIDTAGSVQTCENCGSRTQVTS